MADLGIDTFFATKVDSGERDWSQAHLGQIQVSLESLLGITLVIQV